MHLSFGEMKGKVFFVFWLGASTWLQAQQLVFPEQSNWTTIGEGERVSFKVAAMDSLKTSLKPQKFSLEGVNESGIEFDSLGNFSWKPSFDFVDRLEKQKEFTVIFQAEWADGRRIRKPVTFTVLHKNRPPMVEDLPVFYVKQGVVNHYQISADYVIDPDKDPLVFKSIQSQMPEGATLSSAGLLNWTPSRSQFIALKGTDMWVGFMVEDQPEKAETLGKIRIAQTQQDLPPEMLIVPGDSVITIKEDERVNLKIYMTDPNGDDDIKGTEFLSSDSRVSKTSLRNNTNTQLEFTWTPGYAFTNDAERTKTVDIIFFSLDKSNNRVQKKVRVVVMDAENLEEKDKLLYQKYRNSLIMAKALIDRLDENQDKLNKAYKQAKKGKRHRGIVNISLGATTGLSPVVLSGDGSKYVSGVGGTAVATLGTLEATEIIGKSKQDILEKQKINIEIKNQLRVEGGNFARKYSLKSNRRLKDFDIDQDKLLPIINDQRLMMLELDANRTAYPKYETKDIKKTFPDFTEE